MCPGLPDPTTRSRPAPVDDAVYDYRAYGLRIRSAVALPFDPLPEPSASAPDVTVRLGAVPGTLPGGPAGRSLFPPHWQARPGAFLMHVEGVVRYLATGGRDVLIEPLGADAGGVADFFPGTPFTALLQQRGVATLHAAAVATGAGAVLLLGRSGIGKSSLAAALVERGWALLADDVTGVAPDAGGRALALPGFSRQRLCAHTLDEMGWRGRARSRVRDGVEKYWTPAQRVCAAPLPVRAAFVLAVADRPEVGIEPMPPNLAFRVLRHNTHRRRAMEAMGERPAHFRALAAMARQAPVARVTRPRHPFLLDALADRVEAYLHDAEAGRAGPNAPSPLKAAGNPKAVPVAASAASTSASAAVASSLR